MKNQEKILIIEFCDYVDYPIGGYLTFAKNLMIAFGNNLALVGITSDKKDPIGKWFKKSIDGVIFDFFAFACYSKSTTKHFIPDRLASYLLISFYKKSILKINILNIFIQRPEVLICIKNFGYTNICFCFAGLENPLAISKFWYAQYFAKFFDYLFFKNLIKIQVILASGDESAIQEMIQRSNGLIVRESVIPFPSRINTDIFKPLDKFEIRELLKIPDNKTVIITTGRLVELKGWRFMIDCFCLYEKLDPGSLFYFIGVGEDMLTIEEYIDSKGMKNNIILAGKKNVHDVAKFLNAADLFIMGSYKEGWSTSLLESIACGIPACVTNFSSSKEIVIEGLNGSVIDDHNIELFIKGMIKSIKLKKPVYNENITAFSVHNLKEQLLNHWKLV